MNFFKLFPQVEVDLVKDGNIQKMVHTFKSVRPLQNFIDQPSLYTFYNIKNGERPDIVSQRIYGTPEYYWTFFVVNEFLHDGYRAWPCSMEVLDDYINTEYEGFAITTEPFITPNSDGAVDEFTNSLAGENRTYVEADGTRYRIGETITGGTSGATGKLTKKSMDLNQLIVQEVTGTFLAGENIIGSATVQAFEVFKYAEAPHHFYLIGDKEERYITPRKYVNTNAATANGLYEYKSNRQYVHAKNEERSQIRVLQPEYISQFVEEFENLINE